jgi:hypothetical protein
MAFKFVFGNTLLILLTHFLSISGNIYWRRNKCAYNWSFLLHTGMDLLSSLILNFIILLFQSAQRRIRAMVAGPSGPGAVLPILPNGGPTNQPAEASPPQPQL